MTAMTLSRQISLRTIFVVVLVCAICLGIWVEGARAVGLIGAIVLGIIGLTWHTSLRTRVNISITLLLILPIVVPWGHLPIVWVAGDKYYHAILSDSGAYVKFRYVYAFWLGIGAALVVPGTIKRVSNKLFKRQSSSEERAPDQSSPRLRVDNNPKVAVSSACGEDRRIL